jgi:hypothetical protein
MKEEPEWVKMKRLGFRIPNEKDGVIHGTVVKTSPSAIDKANAKLRQICEPPGVWNDDDYDDDGADERLNE